jgi:hypothetical protein
VCYRRNRWNPQRRITGTDPSVSEETPRYVPERPLPPYAFWGGGPHPHPRRDPEGHSHGQPEPDPPPLDPASWRDSDAYLYGIDLFNHGFYWEAHEQWEALWVAAGKRGPVAEFMKGLIKLAACGIKVRQGRPRGIRRHSERAVRHFRKVREETGADRFAGLPLPDLEDSSRAIHARAAGLEAGTGHLLHGPLHPSD